MNSLRKCTKDGKFPTALTIAGSDSSGGAGIQADIKTMLSLGVYASSAITALTAQNTLGVRDILNATPTFLANELDAIFTDIYPDAVKIGMVSDKELINTIAKKLVEYKAKNIVLDPVMVATSGSKLISDDAIAALTGKLMPLASLITPNIPEASVLSDMEIKNTDDMIEAARIINERYFKGLDKKPAILLKGGHSICDANDLLYQDGKISWFKASKIDNPNTHGTGCTLSSAITSYLSLGYKLEDAIYYGKSYLTNAIKAGLNLGHGSGPLNHAWAIDNSVYLKKAI